MRFIVKSIICKIKVGLPTFKMFYKFVTIIYVDLSDLALLLVKYLRLVALLPISLARLLILEEVGFIYLKLYWATVVFW